MKPSIMFVGVGLATAFSATAAAQQTQPGASTTITTTESTTTCSQSPACAQAQAQALAADARAREAQADAARKRKELAEKQKEEALKKQNSPGGIVPAVSSGARDVNKVVVGAPQQRKNDIEAHAPRRYGQANMQPNAPAIDERPGVIADVTRWTDKPGDYRPFSAEFNPLGLLIGGRLSFTAEWAPVVHNAIVLNGYYVNTSADVAMSGETFETQTFTGGGGELGYRYYTGHRGMNGIFIGPSLILGSYSASLPHGNQFFTNAGVAVDAGVQTILADHFLVGAGAGIEYLNVSHDFHDLSTGPSTVASSGLKPRVLLSAGYGF
jgi:hypothetical protein